MKLIKDIDINNYPSDIHKQVRSMLISRCQSRLTPNDVLSVASEFSQDKNSALKVIAEFGRWVVVKDDISLQIDNAEKYFNIEELGTEQENLANYLAKQILGYYTEGWKAYLVVGEKVSVFIDQIDGDKWAKDWIESVYYEYCTTLPLLDYTNHNLAIVDHIVDGGVISLWNGERVIAQAVIIRTPMNWTQVTLSRPAPYEVFPNVG